MMPPTLTSLLADSTKTELHLAHPDWLWALVLLLPLMLLHRRKGSVAHITHPAMGKMLPQEKHQPTTLAGKIGKICLLAALSALIIALAQPQKKSETQEELVSGVDIMITFDLSGSMNMRDMRFSQRDHRGYMRQQVVDRLTAAKQVINHFIERRPNDRIGLVAFASKAKLSCPLTLDHGLLHYVIDNFFAGERRGRSYFAEDGTAIGSAIALAATRLEENKDTKSKIIILVTDGQNNRGSISPVEAAKQAATLGIRIFTIAIGREERLAQGVNTSGIDEKTLVEIAHLTQGQYFRANSGGELLQAFSRIDELEKTEAKRRTISHYKPLFIYPLSLAALLMLLGFSLQYLRPQPAP